MDAIALMDEWGVGRAGIDDGLVILFDLHENDPCHGQVQLYAGPGYAASYLSNAERQAIFDDDMLPMLRECDLDGALLTAMAKVDSNATPGHAAMITFFRQLNAVLGLIVAPLLFVLVMSWAILTWFRHGRDPIYLDDPSIHIPAPPPGLTPAAGATIRDGNVSRRALTAASLDLAVRGLISFEAEDKPGLLASGQQIGIHTDGTIRGDPSDQARIAVGPPAADGRRHGVPAPPAAGDRRRRQFLHRPDEITKLGTDVGELREARRGALRRSRAGSSSGPPWPRAAGSDGRCSPLSAGSSPSSSAPTCRPTASPSWAPRSSRRASA